MDPGVDYKPREGEGDKRPHQDRSSIGFDCHGFHSFPVVLDRDQKRWELPLGNPPASIFASLSVTKSASSFFSAIISINIFILPGVACK